MADSDKQLVHELATVYASKNFKPGSDTPKDLLHAYQNAYAEIEKALDGPDNPPGPGDFGVHTYD